MNRTRLLADVSHRLGRRDLVWAGIRGGDMESIADLPNLTTSHSIIGAYKARAAIDGVAMEDLSGVRVDLERWDIDDHRLEPAAVAFRRSLLRALNRDSALLPYRPSRFLSAIWFARRDRCLNLGLFGAQQFAFEHKPWVESAVAGLGVPSISWHYIADEDQLDAVALLDSGPLVLRLSRTSGGEGIVEVESPQQLFDLWPKADEAFVSVAPFIAHALPLNVGGTVWKDGTTVHYPSVQVIGIPECVTRRFGYCGNDFTTIRDLDDRVINDIESSTITIGEWLRTQGYLGTFGVDYLLDSEGVLRFTEVNPRFQGSTIASGRLAVERNEPCLPLEHLAAFLGVSTPAYPPLRERVRDLHPLSQVIVHWTGPQTRHIDPDRLVSAMTQLGGSADVLTRPDIATERGAVVGRFTFRTRLTLNGFDIITPVSSALGAWQSRTASGFEGDQC